MWNASGEIMCQLHPVNQRVSSTILNQAGLEVYRAVRPDCGGFNQLNNEKGGSGWLTKESGSSRTRYVG